MFLKALGLGIVIMVIYSVMPIMGVTSMSSFARNKLANKTPEQNKKDTFWGLVICWFTELGLMIFANWFVGLDIAGPRVIPAYNGLVVAIWATFFAFSIYMLWRYKRLSRWLEAQTITGTFYPPSI